MRYYPTPLLMLRNFAIEERGNVNAYRETSLTSTNLSLLYPLAIHYNDQTSFIPLQLLLGPIPQLPSQLLIIRQLIMRPRHAHRLIKTAISNLLLLRSRRPQLIARALFQRQHLTHIRHIHERLVPKA